MRIRITRPAHGSAEGINLRGLQVGFSYDVSPALGAKLVTTNCAELIASEEPMLLVRIPAENRAPTSSRAVGVADDLGRRESLLVFEPADPK